MKIESDRIQDKSESDRILINCGEIINSRRGQDQDQKMQLQERTLNFLNNYEHAHFITKYKITIKGPI